MSASGQTPHDALRARIARLEEENRELARALDEARAEATENVLNHARASFDPPSPPLATIGWLVVIALTFGSCTRMTDSRFEPAAKRAGSQR